MKELHWFELKQLDRVTNYSTEIEPLKTANLMGMKATYYCTFNRKKEYYGLQNQIVYLGHFKNKIIKTLEFYLLVILKAISIVLKSNNAVIMVNQNLIIHVLPALLLNKIRRGKNRFVVDIRTTPTEPSTFDIDMNKLHDQFKYAVNYFDGLSFITPFMRSYLMTKYKVNKPSVTWSSGVDVDLFKPSLTNTDKAEMPFTVFYHGGISESRGNLNLIAACEKLNNEGLNIHLIQMGICVDNSIPEYIDKKQIGSWCKLLPPVPLREVPKHVEIADLPVLPFPNFLAWRVSSPIKLMEYLAMGKKVLAPDMEAFTDVFSKNSELVFYFDSTADNQILEIAKQIKTIYQNKLLDDYHPEHCIQFVSQQYTWALQSQRLLNFVNGL